MCGIYGMVSFAGPLAAPEAFARMGRAVRHRGPDGHGVLTGDAARVGAERLRVVDPHPESDQPFVDPGGCVWLVANGEIYNARDLRARHGGYPYRAPRSDVEPVLALYLARGPAGFAELDGMFAAAVWDARRRRLVLARDRAGEKPLFWARRGTQVWFASEVQALLEWPALSRELDTEAVRHVLALGYVREPRTMFAHVRKVPAGTTLVITARGEAAHRYWQPEEVPRESPPLPAAGAERHLARLLECAVRRQLEADAPVGVFTSGGLDSSLLAALAAPARGRDRLPLFTVGFADRSYDESAPAGRVARFLGTPHVTVLADEAALREALDVVIDRVAEPIADPAILPTYLLAREARNHVKVVLSGEGADELFGGYPTYVGHKLAPLYGRLPPAVRAAVRRVVLRVPTSAGKVPIEYLLKRFVAEVERDWLARHVAWFGTGLVGDVRHPTSDVRGIEAGLDALCSDIGRRTSDLLHTAMLFDYLTYLRDGLLPKLDRATMLCALEARAPYLDRDVTWFALGLDPSLRLRGLTTKWILRRVAHRRLPPAVVRRRKRGLSVPLAAWVNGGLRQEVDRLLDRRRLEAGGLVPADAAVRLLLEHRTGRANHARALWPMIVLERWRERWAR